MKEANRGGVASEEEKKSGRIILMDGDGCMRKKTNKG